MPIRITKLTAMLEAEKVMQEALASLSDSEKKVYNETAAFDADGEYVNTKNSNPYGSTVNRNELIAAHNTLGFHHTHEAAKHAHNVLRGLKANKSRMDVGSSYDKMQKHYAKAKHHNKMGRTSFDGSSSTRDAHNLIKKAYKAYKNTP